MATSDPTACNTCAHTSAEHSTLVGCLADGCGCQHYALAPAQGLQEGRQRRDEGVEAAGSTVPAVLASAWKVKAAEAMEELIRYGSHFSADDLVAIAGMPPRPNMLGGVFISARKAGLIRPAGYTQATRPEAHARVQRTWAGA